MKTQVNRKVQIKKTQRRSVIFLFGRYILCMNKQRNEERTKCIGEYPKYDAVVVENTRYFI